MGPWVKISAGWYEMLLRIEGLDLEHRVEGSISGKDD
jgi:hypothetical protein